MFCLPTSVVKILHSEFPLHTCNSQPYIVLPLTLRRLLLICQGPNLLKLPLVCYSIAHEKYEINSLTVINVRHLEVTQLNSSYPYFSVVLPSGTQLIHCQNYSATKGG